LTIDIKVAAMPNVIDFGFKPITRAKNHQENELHDAEA